MNVLIVGNRLDMALGYPTSLNKCAKWLCDENKEKKVKYYNYVMNHYPNKGLFNGNLWSDLETNMMYVKEPPKGESQNKWYNSYLWHDMYQLFRLWVLHISKYVDKTPPSPKNKNEVELIKN